MCFGWADLQKNIIKIAHYKKHVFAFMSETCTRSTLCTKNQLQVLGLFPLRFLKRLYFPAFFFVLFIIFRVSLLWFFRCALRAFSNSTIASLSAFFCFFSAFDLLSGRSTLQDELTRIGNIAMSKSIIILRKLLRNPCFIIEWSKKLKLSKITLILFLSVAQESVYNI